MSGLAVGRVATAVVFLMLGRGAATAQTPGTAPDTFTFAVTAGDEAQRLFQVGLSWLHSFEYEQALDAFQQARRVEPDFAMASWGEAMCYQQFLWGNEDVAMARQILARLGATPAARAARAPTARERRWLATLDVLFGDGDRPTRLRAYAESMRLLTVEDPADLEAALFHGLAVMSTASRGLAGAHHAEPFAAPLLAGSDAQRQSAEIFTAVLARQPRHPGALHYLIHAYDDPAHAELALDAARVYASVVPESSHARHMPAHVFVQLGRWAAAAASDEAAFAASESMMTRKSLPATMRDYHALSWLVYEYLQMGRFRDARAALDKLAVVADESRLPSLLSLRATLKARLVVEGGFWSELPGPNYVNYDELFAVGLGAVRRGDVRLAELARQRLAEMGASDRYRERRPLLEVMSRVLSGQLRTAAGDVSGATAVLRQAVELERALPSEIGPPALIKPAFEFLGESLLAQSNGADADAQFAAGLERARNRSAAVLGRARAKALLGDAVAARAEYATFLENWKIADADRAELDEARRAQVLPSAVARLGLRAWPVVTGVAVAAAAILLVRRRHHRQARRTHPSRQRRPRRTSS